MVVRTAGAVPSALPKVIAQLAEANQENRRLKADKSFLVRILKTVLAEFGEEERLAHILAELPSRSATGGDGGADDDRRGRLRGHDGRLGG